MKTLYAMGFATMLFSGTAFAAGEECKTDVDCGAGEFCAAAPCLPPDCDPDDPTCVTPECPSMCSPKGDPTDPIPDPSGCQTDADCGNGFECTVMGTAGTSCACPEGAESCDCPPDAAPVEYKACAPKACAADSDCPSGLECVTVSEPCAAPAIDCAPGEACPDPIPCEPTTRSWCSPKWAGTCEADADCGEGFSCKAYEQCTCSGSSGSGSSGSSSSGGGETPASDGGGAPPPAEDAGSSGEPADPANPGAPIDDGCTCAPSDEKYCEPVKQTCESDSDCPTDWKCEDFGTVSSGGTATDVACPPGETCDADAGSAGAMPMPPAESNKMCTPPYYSDYANAGALPPEGPMADGESFPTRTKDGDGTPTDTGNTDGTDGSSTTGGTDESTGGTGSTTAKSASAGCTVDGTGRMGFGLPALLLLGLAGLFGRRRSSAR